MRSGNVVIVAVSAVVLGIFQFLPVSAQEHQQDRNGNLRLSRGPNTLKDKWEEYAALPQVEIKAGEAFGYTLLEHLLHSTAHINESNLPSRTKLDRSLERGMLKVNTSDPSRDWADLIRGLAWPLVALYALWQFRGGIRQVLARIPWERTTSVKAGGLGELTMTITEKKTVEETLISPGEVPVQVTSNIEKSRCQNT